MTAERYFTVCEQMGVEPQEDKIPPEVDDFPLDVQKAMVLFNKLGDRVLPDIGYLGKDYSQLPIYMDVYEIKNRKLFLDTLVRLDEKMIQKSAAEMKAARDRIKRGA